MTITRDPIPDQQSPPTRPRWLLLAAAVVVMSAIAVWAFWPRTTPEATPAPATPTTHPAQAPAAASDCPATPADPLTVDAITGTTWQLQGTVPLPSRAGVGPAVTTPLRRCYADSQAGAFFAVLNFQGATNNHALAPVDIATWLIAPGPERDVILATIAAAPASTGLPQMDTRPQVQWRGFHVVAYTTQQAAIDVTWAEGDRLYATLYTATWDGNDWRVVMPQALQFDVRSLPTLDPLYWHLLVSS